MNKLFLLLSLLCFYTIAFGFDKSNITYFYDAQLSNTALNITSNHIGALNPNLSLYDTNLITFKINLKVLNNALEVAKVANVNNIKININSLKLSLPIGKYGSIGVQAHEFIDFKYSLNDTILRQNYEVSSNLNKITFFYSKRFSLFTFGVGVNKYLGEDKSYLVEETEAWSPVYSQDASINYKYKNIDNITVSSLIPLRDLKFGLVYESPLKLQYKTKIKIGSFNDSKDIFAPTVDSVVNYFEVPGRFLFGISYTFNKNLDWSATIGSNTNSVFDDYLIAGNSLRWKVYEFPVEMGLIYEKNYNKKSYTGSLGSSYLIGKSEGLFDFSIGYTYSKDNLIKENKIFLNIGLSLINEWGRLY